MIQDFEARLLRPREKKGFRRPTPARKSKTVILRQT
jgi:hypothetical protein